MTINWCPPAFVSYVNTLPHGFGGMANGIFIRILKKYENDKGLLMHELEHVKQGWCLLFVFHILLYRYNRGYRQWAEVKAYRKQMKYTMYDGKTYMDLDSAARWLMLPKYKLGLTEKQARAALLRVD
ncbi:MAG TPA: hypothetical protein VMW24_10980 [Sedimentisphaerales bacterium]|nr:hypothetical protein [Sedimentisphaerales bacterium]